jgi:3-deoxy-D-manno-octulosonic-acid transferase
LSGANPTAQTRLAVPSGMLTALYRLLWYPALPFALIASGGRDAATRRERRGAIADPFGAEGTPRIWVHAASVGEIEAVRPVVQGLVRKFTGAMVVVTTMTEAGRSAARRRLPEAAAWQLAPLDCPSTVRAFLGAVRPDLVLIAETELWPNYLIESARRGARVAIVNGRVSARSVRRYRYVRSLIADALAHIHLVLAQSDEDAARFAELGAPPSTIVVTGNTKFVIDPSEAPLRPALRDFAPGRQIVVAGSTAPGEERMILTAYRNLLDRFPALALIIAPRHLDRVSEVEAEIQAARLTYVRAQALPAADAPAAVRAASAAAYAHTQVLLLDTMGELRGLYRRATVAFVGGSMTPARGGQNLGEPAAVAVPVIFGPHYENQRPVGDALIEMGGGRVVNDVAQIESTCAEWLEDHEGRRAAGSKARRSVERLAGGAAAALNHLGALIGRL